MKFKCPSIVTTITNSDSLILNFLIICTHKNATVVTRGKTMLKEYKSGPSRPSCGSKITGRTPLNFHLTYVFILLI